MDAPTPGAPYVLTWDYTDGGCGDSFGITSHRDPTERSLLTREEALTLAAAVQIAVPNLREMLLWTWRGDELCVDLRASI